MPIRFSKSGKYVDVTFAIFLMSWLDGWMDGWVASSDGPVSTTTSSLLFTKFSGHCLTWPINEASSSLFRIGSYTGKRIMWEPIRDRRVGESKQFVDGSNYFPIKSLFRRSMSPGERWRRKLTSRLLWVF